jgi:hypothetical protein
VVYSEFVLDCSYQKHDRLQTSRQARFDPQAINGRVGGHKMPCESLSGHRFPAEIICYAIWLYHVSGLSLCNVELILAERGVTVSYETV